MPDAIFWGVLVRSEVSVNFSPSLLFTSSLLLAEPSWRLLLPWSIPSQKRYSMSCCCHRSVAVEGLSKLVCPWHVSSNFQQDSCQLSWVFSVGRHWTWMMELSWVVTYNRERRSILVSAPQRRKLKSGIVGTQMADCHLAFIGQSLLKFQIVVVFCFCLQSCFLLASWFR